ncbi:MAG: response regulator [Bacteroidetes bacterium]|nr:response regulator [Bacteroidota bacterium]
MALIVEDDPKLGRIFSAALSQVGFEVTWDEDGTRYKKILETATPSVIFLDAHLPFASGAEILDEIRADERWQDIPVVLVTADIALSKSLAKKADISLLKPVSVARIQEIGYAILSELSKE